MPTLQQLVTYVGKIGLIPIGNGMTAQVRVLDVKLSYGRARYFVTPVSGTGDAWVEAITFPKQP